MDNDVGPGGEEGGEYQRQRFVEVMYVCKIILPLQSSLIVWSRCFCEKRKLACEIESVSATPQSSSMVCSSPLEQRHVELDRTLHHVVNLSQFQPKVNNCFAPYVWPFLPRTL